jgi:hypothetical protein
MLDASHPGTGELSQHFAHSRHDTPFEGSADGTAETEGDEEAAWLESIQETGADDLAAVAELQSGDIVLDMTQLRDEPTSAKRSLKGKLPA